jgi:hypothetical protein
VFCKGRDGLNTSVERAGVDSRHGWFERLCQRRKFLGLENAVCAEGGIGGDFCGRGDGGKGLSCYAIGAPVGAVSMSNDIDCCENHLDRFMAGVLGE